MTRICRMDADKFNGRIRIYLLDPRYPRSILFLNFCWRV